MSVERYAQVRALYDAAANLTGDARSALLAAAAPDLRAEVEALLGDQLTDSGDPIASRIATAAEQAINSALPSHIGAYRIIRTLGEGGMGLVLLGERDDGEFTRRVAIKLISGLSTAQARERLRQERQLLAVLEHPQIARLLDGGTTTSGEPYLVMEYIDGETLGSWLTRSCPSLQARIVLMISLCRAVAHAHQNLVIHRDLKPANVMVRANGSPVLLDFGIAKLLDAASVGEHTVSGMMTPAYAAPEQLQQRAATTATDVYGLGMILYHLLCGHVPTREDEPGSLERLPPSALAQRANDPATLPDWRRLRGDLDRIARTAVRADPALRYPSALALAADLSAYLEGRPVQAVGRNWRYISGKFVRRHRFAVGAGVVVLVTLLAAGVVLAIERTRALKAEAAAKHEAMVANQATGFLTQLFAELDPQRHPGRALSGRELLDIGRTQLEAMSADSMVSARLEQSLGEIYHNIGQHQPALELLTAAHKALLQQADAAPLQIAQVELALAGAQHGLGQDAQALRTVGVALQRLAQVDLGDSMLRAHATMLRGVIQQALAQFDQASASFDDAERMFKSATFDQREALSSIAHNRGWMAEDRGDFNAALRAFQDALQTKRALFGAKHPKTLNSLHGVGKALRGIGEFVQAREVLTELLTLRQHVFGPSSRPVQQAHDELASIQQDLGCFQQAASGYAQSLALAERLSPGGASLDVAIARNNFGTLLQDRGAFAQAEVEFRASLAQRRQLLAADHPAVGRSAFNLGRLLLDAKRPLEARPLIDEAHRVRHASLPPNHPDVIAADLLQARLNLDLGAVQPALALLQSANGGIDKIAQPPAALRVTQLRVMAQAASATDQPEAQKNHLNEAVRLAREAWGLNLPKVAQIELELSAALAPNAASRLELLRKITPVLHQALDQNSPVLKQLAMQRAESGLAATTSSIDELSLICAPQNLAPDGAAVAPNPAAG